MNRRTSDPSEEFFDQVAASPQPLEHAVTATIRIHLYDHGGTQSWLLRIDEGRVHVARDATRAADATIHTDRAFFDRMVTGEANALSAALRGRMRIDGDLRLLVAFSRLMPSPPGRTTTVPAVDRTAMEAARTVRADGTASRTAKASVAIDRATRKDRAR